MAAKYILATLAAIFLLAGTLGMATGRSRAQGRIWLRIALIFGAVSLWLFVRG